MMRTTKTTRKMITVGAPKPCSDLPASLIRLPFLAELEKPKAAKTAKSTSKSSKQGKIKTGRKKATSDDEDDDDEFTMDVEKEEEGGYPLSHLI